MTVYLEIANRLQHEIEAAKAHLAQLETAFAAMQPLVTVEMGTVDASHRALPYTLEVTDVSDAELVDSGVADESTSGHPDSGSVPVRKRRRKLSSSNAAVVLKKASKRQQAEAPPAKLPATSGNFWMAIMGKRAYSVPDIVDRAIAKLELTEAARPVLTNRLSAWLYPSMKSGKVQPGPSKGKLKRYALVATD